MSAEAMTWAFRQHELPPPERFVLVTLADRANQDGVCWPSLRDLALRTGYTQRYVRDKVAALVKRGLIERVERTGERGRQSSNLYILRMDRGNTWREIGRNLDRVAEYNASLPRTARDCGPARDNPVDNSHPEDQSTPRKFPPPSEPGFRPADGETPPEISALESNTNPDPVDPTESLGTGDAVEKERASVPANTQSAPDGAQGAYFDIGGHSTTEEPERAHAPADTPSGPDGPQSGLQRREFARARLAPLRARMGATR